MLEEFKNYMIFGDNGDGTTTVILCYGEEFEESQRAILPIDFKDWVNGTVPEFDTRENAEKFVEQNAMIVPNRILPGDLS